MWLMACAGGTAKRPVNTEYESMAFETQVISLTPDLEFSISRGQADVKNRYEAVVQLGSERGSCSGVFMTPQLVLTAAHCVCAPADPKISTQVVDGSDCTRRVVVIAGLHSSGDHGHSEYQGKVRVHPGFRAEMEDGRLKSNVADLAVVRLEKPVEGLKIDFKFPTQEVSIDEQLTLVGFGETRYNGKDDGTRRVGHNSVTDIVLSSRGPGSFLFRDPGAHTHAGDSGGPCFRENSEGRWLVGINSGHANGGKVSLFTSTFHYRAWIAEQLRKTDTD
jgi:secreted trypsin-like serine protease